MPARTLPTLPQAEVASHNNEKSCYVTVGTKVYDVTSFVADHPGGGDLILEYGGKDVKEVMEDEVSHAHSEAAWEILDELLVGFVATEKVMEAVMESSDPLSVLPMEPSRKGMNELEKAGTGAVEDVEARRRVSAAGPDAENPDKSVYDTGMSCEEDLYKETDIREDYRKHKFLDLDKPLLMQVWRGGFTNEFYLQQIHRPRYCRKYGGSPLLFGNILEPLSKTPVWVPPMVWLPVVAWTLWTAGQNLSPLAVAAYFFVGLCFWTLIEYTLHRGLFHITDSLPEGSFFQTAHFLLHGIHHYVPMDPMRLVMPPTLACVLIAPFILVARTIVFWSTYGAMAAFSGGLCGFVVYDCLHWAMHHTSLPAHMQELKKYHLEHHYKDSDNGFGVTSRFWDRVFGTELPSTLAPKVVKTT